MKNEFKIFDYNEVDIAKRWAYHFSDEFKWIPENKEWFYWNGSHWLKDIESKQMLTFDDIIEMLKQERILLDAELEAMYLKIGRITQKEMERMAPHSENHQVALEICRRRRACYVWVENMTFKTSIQNVTKLSVARPNVSKSIVEFDNKGHILGLKNGAFNLYKGTFVQNDPKFLITKYCDVEINPFASCPNWIRLLNQIFKDQPETISFLQRVFGQALLGTSDKSKLIMFNGIGANGKSTIVDTILALLSSYGNTTTADALTGAKKGGEYFTAELKGVRLNIINESNRGAFLNEALVKSLIDSGPVQARQIYGFPFTFQPVATTILCTNYLPGISGDYAIGRRILLVPFDYQMPEEERIADYREKYLLPELQGILNWAILGCMEYQKIGLAPPKVITDATKQYIFDNNRVARFVEECCVKDPTKKVKLTDFRSHFEDWCNDQGFKVITSDKIGQDLRSLGYDVLKSNGGNYHAFGLAYDPLSVQRLRLQSVKDNILAI